MERHNAEGSADRRRSTRTRSLLAACCLLVHAGASLADELVFGGPAVLTGQVDVVIRFGPPNYGENPKTDLKTEITLLRLARPVHILGGSDEVEEGEPVDATEVQLVLPEGVDAYDWVEKDAVATGRIRRKIHGAGSHAAILDVEKIVAKPRERSMHIRVAPPTTSVERERARKE